jgi:RNA polymerase sigma-70 factor (ECF subfamily)
MWASAKPREPYHDDLGPEPGGGGPVRLRVLSEDVYPSWEAAYKDNVGRLYHLMYARVGNRPDAEDLTAEVFRAAMGPLRLVASKGEVRSYLLMTARTVLASHWRDRLGHPVTSIDPERDAQFLDDGGAPDPASDAPERVRRILAALPERYRQILELRFLQASSIKEAAKVMNITVGNAKVLQHRALQMAAKLSTESDQ